MFSRPTGLARLDGEERFWGSTCRLDQTGSHRVWSSPIGVTARADRTPSPKLQESRPPTRSGLMSATLVMPEPWFHGPLGELLERTFDGRAFSCSSRTPHPSGRLTKFKSPSLVLFRVSRRESMRSTEGIGRLIVRFSRKFEANHPSSSMAATALAGTWRSFPAPLTP